MKKYQIGRYFARIRPTVLSSASGHLNIKPYQPLFLSTSSLTHTSALLLSLCRQLRSLPIQLVSSRYSSFYHIVFRSYPLLFAQVGHAEAEIDPIDMRGLAEQVKRGLKHEIEAREAEVTVEDDDWAMALGHQSWVEQVWANYISNALKYGGSPPKIVLVWSMGSDGDPEFWVRDNGPGLTEAQCQQVFREFERLDEAKTEAGHGLGLSIVRRIVEKLDGNVGLESTRGQGSRFYFTLKAVSGARKGEEANVALPG